MTTSPNPIDAEPLPDVDHEMDERTRAIALRAPGVPTSLEELQALKAQGEEILEARFRILQTLHKSALRLTWPSDWVLFAAPAEHGGQIVGYLQDCGAERMRDLYGIEIFDLGEPQRSAGANPGEFFYVITGSGRCSITGQTVERMEGGRASTEDFCKDKSGMDLELAVRKAARANLDGNITRELSGLKSVPLEEIAEAWRGSPKSTEQCRRGRGFGTRDERLGAATVDANIPKPACDVCGKPMLLRKGSRGPFYSCGDYREHRAAGRESKTWELDKWIAELERRKAAAPPASSSPQKSGEPEPSPAPAAARVEPLTAEEIDFGGGRRAPGRRREPGEEG